MKKNNQCGRGVTRLPRSRFVIKMWYGSQAAFQHRSSRRKRSHRGLVSQWPTLPSFSIAWVWIFLFAIHYSCWQPLQVPPDSFKQHLFQRNASLLERGSLHVQCCCRTLHGLSTGHRESILCSLCLSVSSYSLSALRDPVGTGTPPYRTTKPKICTWPKMIWPFSM